MELSHLSCQRVYIEGGDMKKSIVATVTILIAAILAGSGTAQADSPDTEMMRSLVDGYNIYAPNVMWDNQEMVYKMWYGGFAEGPKDGETDSDLEDAIYYRTSKDRINWTEPVPGPVITVADLNPEGLDPDDPWKITHVNDPSVTKHFNRHAGENGAWQYTMFYTVCIYDPCYHSLADIQSAVSADGINWKHHQSFNPRMLLPPDISWDEWETPCGNRDFNRFEHGSAGQCGPAEPYAIFNGNRSSWDVYYVDRLDAGKVKKIEVRGDRTLADWVKPERVYTTPEGSANISGIEVHFINGEWQLFFNVFHASQIDIAKVTSESRHRFEGPFEYIVVNPGDIYCGTLTPGVLPLGHLNHLKRDSRDYSKEYDLYFGLQKRDPSKDGCYPGSMKSIVGWQMVD